MNYAAPLGAPVETRWIARHRLEKVDPAAPRSRVKEPIVYYVDSGAPEPVRERPGRGRGLVEARRSRRPVSSTPTASRSCRPAPTRWTRATTSSSGSTARPAAGPTAAASSIRAPARSSRGTSRSARCGCGRTACSSRAWPARRRPAPERPDDPVAALARPHPPARRARGGAQPRPLAQLRRLHLRPRLGDGLPGAAGGGHARRRPRLLAGLRGRDGGVGPVRHPLRLCQFAAGDGRRAAFLDAMAREAASPRPALPDRRGRPARGCGQPARRALGQRRRSRSTALRHALAVRRIGLARFGEHNIAPGPAAGPAPGGAGAGLLPSPLPARRRASRWWAAWTTPTRCAATASAAAAAGGARSGSARRWTPSWSALEPEALDLPEPVLRAAAAAAGRLRPEPGAVPWLRRARLRSARRGGDRGGHGGPGAAPARARRPPGRLPPPRPAASPGSRTCSTAWSRPPFLRAGAGRPAARRAAPRGAVGGGAADDRAVERSGRRARRPRPGGRRAGGAAPPAEHRWRGVGRGGRAPVLPVPRDRALPGPSGA